MRFEFPIWKVKPMLEQYHRLSSLVEHLSPTLKLSRVFGLISGLWLLLLQYAAPV